MFTKFLFRQEQRLVKKGRSFMYAIMLLLLFTGCSKDNNLLDDLLLPLGWNGSDNNSAIPSSLSTFGGTVPSSYDLTQYLPPVGNQGEFGTCVAWSVGYNTKTATEAITNNWTASQLSSTAYQKSPKDLFTAIADSKKGANCNGTNFTDALDVLQSRGVASMQTVPYSSLAGCVTSNTQPAWTTEAAQHKIKYYRKIQLNTTTIKQQIANKIPVMLGAKIYANFMSWNSANVYSSFSGNFNGYHAMAIVGYDDAQGFGGAFKVVNSWGTNWGSQGFVWVDYNFLTSSFCYDGSVYILADDGGGSNPPPPPPNTTGADLVPWAFSDYSNYPFSGISYERKISLNIYNIGNAPASPSSNWSLYYIYYNAYNANDYGLLFADQFNTSVAPNSYNCPTSQSCIFNYNIPGGSNFAQMVFGSSSIIRTYHVPAISGYYYLVLYADATAVITEQNEQNNVFYTTNQYPKLFNNGYSDRQNTAIDTAGLTFTNDMQATPLNLKKNKYNSAVNENNKNAYTPAEILQFLKERKQSGDLDRKINEFKSKPSNKSPY